jgi:hypothetical protein
MAQQDAMEQVKEFLRQVIKYRFWISIGVAALFALIAYMVGSGPIRAKAEDETKKITAALTDVKKYTSNTIPTADYKPIVDEKTNILDKDVKTAWKTLYDRQAPLLTWPETVQERFRKWGRQWPKDEDPGKVNLAIVDFIEAYPGYVAMVYKTFNPFNYESGEGIVAAAPQDVLLRPATFQIEHLPNLGKVWSAQERLWIQRTVLEVVAQVNKAAKNWDDAIIKQIETLEVGNQIAQDQRSVAKGEQLEPAAEIYAPGEEEAAQAAEAAGGSAAGSSGSAMASGMASQFMGMKTRGAGEMSMMGGGAAMGMGMMGGGGGALGKDEGVYYVKNENDKGQYKILPILISVLIDQDRIQDFLVELENSPMSIQVMDMEMSRPQTRVAKPEKGDASAGGFAGMGGMGGSMGMMMMRMRGGEAGAMGGMMGRGMGGYAGMMGSMQMSMRGRMAEMMGGMGMGMGGSSSQRKGTDVRSTNRAKEREKQSKELEKVHGPSLSDPHFDVVQVTVWGQARFFNPPPVDETAQPSLGETAAGAGSAPSAPGAAPPAAAASSSTAPASGAVGGAQTKQGGSDAKSQSSAAAKAEAAPPGKTEPPKADTPKPDATKGAPKSGAPKS